MDKIRWIKVTHRPEKIDIGSNSRWNQDVIPHSHPQDAWARVVVVEFDTHGKSDLLVHTQNTSLSLALTCVGVSVEL